MTVLWYWDILQQCCTILIFLILPNTNWYINVGICIVSDKPLFDSLWHSNYSIFELRMPSAFFEYLLLCTSCNYKLHIPLWRLRSMGLISVYFAYKPVARKIWYYPWPQSFDDAKEQGFIFCWRLSEFMGKGKGFDCGFWIWCPAVPNSWA